MSDQCKTFSDHCETCCCSDGCKTKACMITVDSFIKIDKEEIAELKSKIENLKQLLQEIAVFGKANPGRGFTCATMAEEKLT